MHLHGCHHLAALWWKRGGQFPVNASKKNSMELSTTSVGPIHNLIFQTWGPSNLKGQNFGLFVCKIKTLSRPVLDLFWIFSCYFCDFANNYLLYHTRWKFFLRDQEHTNKECDSSFHKNTDAEIKLKKSHLVPSKLLKIGQNPAWEFLNFFSGS